VVTIDDGRVSTGIIAHETATSITLKRAENVQETILRQNIDELSSTGTSLMPEGMEKKIRPQEMADLLAYVLGR
jgi:putative heme-binding domain-containing protein